MQAINELLNYCEQLKKNGQRDLAYKYASSAWQKEPNDTRLADFLGQFAYEECRYEEALMYLSVIERGGAWGVGQAFNKVQCLYSLRRISEALPLIEEIYQGNPREPAYAFIYSLILSNLGRFDESYKAIESIPDTLWGMSSQRGRYMLRQGRSREAYKLCQDDERFYSVEHIYRELPHEKKYHSGIDLRGKHLFIIQQGGIGDCFAFLRFIEAYRALGANISIGANDILRPLLTRLLGPVIPVVDPKLVHPDEYDYYISDSIPNTMLVLDRPDPSSGLMIPYISSSLLYKKRWGNKLKRHNGRPNIALHWQGARDTNSAPQGRDVPYTLLKKFSNIGTLYSFQRDGGSRDIMKGDPVIDIGTKFESLEDTLGALEAMDYVVTNDALLFHLSGALGKKVLLLVCLDPNCIWLSSEEETDWYPNVKVFRQQTYDDWETPLTAAYEWMAKDMRSPSPAGGVKK